MIIDLSYANVGFKIKKCDEYDKVILRCGIRDHIDTEFINFAQMCEEEKVPFDVYWYVKEGTLEETYNLIEVLTRHVIGYPMFNGTVYLDMEDEELLTDSFNEQLQDYLSSTFDLINDNVPDINISVYTFYNYYLTNQKIFKAYQNLWIAAWDYPSLNHDNISLQQKGTITLDGFKIDYNIDVDKYNYSKFVSIYASAYSKNPSSWCPNTKLFWYDDVVVNGRRRVTCSPDFVNKIPITQYVTGWTDSNIVLQNNPQNLANTYIDIYVSAYSHVVANTLKNIPVYLLDKGEPWIVKSKVRITIDEASKESDDVLKCTGWVNYDDLKKYKYFKE